MKAKLVIPTTIAAALGLGACGGSSSSNSASALAHSRPTRIYRVALTGAAEPARGAPGGTGVAIIAFHGPGTICWRFAHLHGFTNATSARIYSGARGRSGKVAASLSPGPRLHHQGCVSLSSALTKSIWSRPADYYLNIHSARYPAGAVRAQL